MLESFSREQLFELVFADEAHRRAVVDQLVVTTPQRHREEKDLGCKSFGPILVYAGLDPLDGPYLMAFLLIGAAEVKERRRALLAWMFDMQDNGTTPVVVEHTLTPDLRDFATFRIVSPEELGKPSDAAGHLMVHVAR